MNARRTTSDEALLVYNQNAGGFTEDRSLVYQRALEEAGFEPVYRVTRQEEDLDEVLASAKGLVVAVGGDGTLRAVATRLVGRQIPLALIPNGTANNIGRSLGIQGDPEQLIAGLSHPRLRRFDLGKVSSPKRTEYFLEGAGFGLYAEALARYRPEQGKSLLRGLATSLELAALSPSTRTRVRVDGVESEDEFLILAAMNTPALGTRLELSSAASVDDGLIDLVTVSLEQRESFLTYLGALLSNDAASCQSVSLTKAQKVEFWWDGYPYHYDAEYQAADDGEEPHWVALEMMQQELEFWLPGDLPNE